MEFCKQSASPTVRLAIFLVLAVGLRWGQVDASAGRSAPWNYDDKGPKDWLKKYPDCGGVLQSPICINTSAVVYDPNLHYFDLSDYSKTEGLKMIVGNIGGHTVEVSVSGTPIYLRGGSLPALYVMEQFHFHWGSNGSRGSEHCIDGNYAPMELHIVHRQIRYLNISQAADKPSGLTVLSFLFKLGSRNTAFDQLIQYFGNISNPDDEREIEPFSISSLLPASSFDFYRYQGSLTTPPCFESVIWSVAAVPLEISEEQVEKFRYFRNENLQRLVNDYRPVQPMNHRTLTSTIKPNNGGNF